MTVPGSLIEEAPCINTFSSDDNLDKHDSTDKGDGFIIVGG